MHRLLFRTTGVSLSVLALSAAPAVAQTSSAKSLAMPVVTVEGQNLATSSVKTAYTDGQVTSSAAVGTISLPAGTQYKATSCLQIHVYGKVPSSTCTSKQVDARSAKSAVSVSLSGQSETSPRPRTGESGYAHHLVTVERLSSGAWQRYATNWPSGPLSTAAVALFPVGMTSGELPAMQGAALDPEAPVHGGVNSGNPDSICVPDVQSANIPRSDVSTTVLGALPAYYEVGEPSGEFAGRPPKGMMLVIHGGGWSTVGSDPVQKLRGEADRWRGRGWRTVALTYRGCGRSLADTLAVYDRVRAQYGSTVPVCALGQSAGGNLALLVAAWRPGGIRCVVNAAGPTDGTALSEQPAFHYPTGADTQHKGPRWVHNFMVAAFGEENLFWFSPVNFAGAGLKGVRVLAATADRDTLVPHGQMTALRDAMRQADADAYVDVRRLATGGTPFVHSGVSEQALAEFHAAEQALVAPITAS